MQEDETTGLEMAYKENCVIIKLPNRYIMIWNASACGWQRLIISSQIKTLWNQMINIKEDCKNCTSWLSICLCHSPKSGILSQRSHSGNWWMLFYGNSVNIEFDSNQLWVI